MNLSLKWLAALLNRTLDITEVAERLTMQVSPVETVEPVHQELGDIVVALVEGVEKHPNADRLSLCQVNDGVEIKEVVCGASNVTPGKKYPYARLGSVLPGGLKLEARKIRGVLSNGMLCSARELGLGTDHSGILELDTDARPGTPFLDVMPIADHRLSLEVSPNRPDLLGHKGVARELAAAYRTPVRLPEFPNAPADALKIDQARVKGNVDGVEVAIEDAEGCPRYLAAVIRGVRIGPSPQWLQVRISSIGARPINNVVDATNYILFELNQPLHAFDLKRLAGPAIVVRRAKAGEPVTTLDGTTRTLTAGMTAICDARQPVAVAGVMGGRDSEVEAATTDLLLECACFDPQRVRKTRTALRLTTEASYRYERGIDLHAMPAALRRAVQLIVAVAGGRATGAVDLYPAPAHEPTVFVRPERVAHVLGLAVPVPEIEQHLTSVGFTVAPKDGRLAVQVPGWRPDVTREIDLIEEIARLRGYHSFPTEPQPLRVSRVPDDPAVAVEARIRRVLTAWGLHEARSYPLGPSGGPASVELTNPLSAEDAFPRSDLLPGLVRAAERNWSVRERDIRLFEIGTVFHRPEAGEVLPTETRRLGVVVSGARTPPHWTASGKSGDYDLWDLKALFEEGVRLVGGGAVVDPWSTEAGRAMELDADRPPWAGRLYGFEVDLGPAERVNPIYQPLPATPPAERDLALVLPRGVRAGQVEGVIRGAGGPLLESLRVFDEYRSEQVGGRSVAWRLVFRAPDRTLRDEEVEGVVKKIVGMLKEELDVRLRES